MAALTKTTKRLLKFTTQKNRNDVMKCLKTLAFYGIITDKRASKIGKAIGKMKGSQWR